jgi:hypothetical protein
MSKRNDIKQEIEEEDKTLGSGEGTLGSGSADLETDDDVDTLEGALENDKPKERE